MPKPAADEIPEKIKPYLFHKWDSSGKSGHERNGDCPFCSGNNKFYVNEETGLYSCKVCDAGMDGKSGGNVYTFMRKLHELSLVILPEIAEVAKERGLQLDTLVRWGFKSSLIDGEWLLPTYDLKNEINNLFRWVPLKQKDGTYKRRLLPTATIDTRLFGMQFWQPDKPDVYICEGVFDAMRLEECLQSYGPNGPRLVKTSNPPKTLYATANILAVPGAETFREEWITNGLFAGKNVTLLYDNDYPRKVCEKCKRGYDTITNQACPKCKGTSGRDVLGAGMNGMRSAVRKLKGAGVRSLRYLEWGESGYDTALSDGWDIRDHLRESA